jgi:hypothetical protein
MLRYDDHQNELIRGPDSYLAWLAGFCRTFGAGTNWYKIVQEKCSFTNERVRQIISAVEPQTIPIGQVLKGSNHGSGPDSAITTIVRPWK